jgi:multidrug resistance efflux pump
MVNLLKKKQIIPSTKAGNKAVTSEQMLQGAIFTVLAGSLSLGILVIRYNLTYLPIDNVIINGRIIHLTAPVSGILRDLNPKPGTEVQSAQLLATIQINSTSQKSNNSQIQSYPKYINKNLTNTNSVKLTIAKKDLVNLKNKLEIVEKEYIDSQGENNLGEQLIQLLSAIQAQDILIKNLESKTKKQPQSKNIFEVLVKAPIAGVVYTTTHEKGEQVTQSQPLITLLDCNDLWLDTIIKADDAQNIDTNKPVKVKLASYKQSVFGKVKLIQRLNNFKYIEENSSQLTKVQALLPAIPSHLSGQSLARVKVKIPRTGSQKIPQRFCGVGESADVVFAKK